MSSAVRSVLDPHHALGLDEPPQIIQRRSATGRSPKARRSVRRRTIDWSTGVVVRVPCRITEQPAVVAAGYLSRPPDLRLFITRTGESSARRL